MVIILAIHVIVMWKHTTKNLSLTITDIIGDRLQSHLISVIITATTTLYF